MTNDNAKTRRAAFEQSNERRIIAKRGKRFKWYFTEEKPVQGRFTLVSRFVKTIACMYLHVTPLTINHSTNRGAVRTTVIQAFSRFSLGWISLWTRAILCLLTFADQTSTSKILIRRNLSKFDRIPFKDNTNTTIIMVAPLSFKREHWDVKLKRVKSLHAYKFNSYLFSNISLSKIWNIVNNFIRCTLYFQIYTVSENYWLIQRKVA